MRDGSISALLVGKQVQGCPELRCWFDSRRLTSEHSASFQEACDRIRQKQFDLIISEYQLPDRTAFPLLSVLAGSPATLFFARALKREFLLLLVVDRGRRCVGNPVVLSRNLHVALDRALHAIENAREMNSLADELTSTHFLVPSH